MRLGSDKLEELGRGEGRQRLPVFGIVANNVSDIVYAAPCSIAEVTNQQ
jgi:hypothetical protein